MVLKTQIFGAREDIPFVPKLNFFGRLDAHEH